MVGTMELEEVQAWIDGYVRAWESGDPAELAALFAEDARYYTHPFREPWRGRDAIVKGWTEHPDAPGSWQAEYRAIAASGKTGVVRGTTKYLKEDGSVDKEYANIYVIEFGDEGMATEFTEFFMAGNPPPRG
jgi:ketosteroid isomerase-like protein